jgi:hypothetical protein
MHGVYKNIIQRYLNDLKKSQEPSNIWEDELLGDSIERTLKIPDNSIGKIQESQENPHGSSTKEFISCCEATFLLHQAHQWIYKMQQKEEVTKEGGDYIEAL